MVASKEELVVAFHKGWEAVGLLTIEQAGAEFEQWFAQQMRYMTRTGTNAAMQGQGFRHVDGTWRTPPGADLIEALEQDRDDWHRRYLVALGDVRQSLESQEKWLGKVQDARMEAARWEGTVESRDEDVGVLTEQNEVLLHEVKRLRTMVTKLGGTWRKVKRG